MTPPREEEEVAPYRPVWRGIIVESTVMFGAAAGLFVLYRFIGFGVPERFRPLVNVGLALLPCVVWLIFSLRPERGVLQPRQRLLAFFLLTALVTNAVIVPLLQDLFEVSLWIPQSPTFGKLLGNMFTVGALNAALIFILMRYLLWPNHIRTRQDMIAYSSAVAIGSVTVWGLRAAFYENPIPHILAGQIFADYGAILAAGVAIGYGIAESFFVNARAFQLPFVTVLGALAIGLMTTVRSSLVSGRFGTDSVSAENALFGFAPLFGLLFSTVFLVVVLLVASFFYTNAEQRERESLAS